MALRQLRVFDDPVLRRPCREVEAVDDGVRSLLRDMADTLYHTESGAGLAACQVGVLRRLVVVDMRDGNGLLHLVNPRIVARAGLQECVEGCLSFPGLWGRTIRPRRVTLEALNENGERVRIDARDELAKCFCHELDHLDGIVLTQRIIKEAPVRKDKR